MAQIAAISKKTAKPRGIPFEKGVSGNPKGRPKQTQEQKDALAAIRELAPAAANVLQEILANEASGAALRLKAAEMILERTYGKAQQTVEITKPKAEIASEISAAMDEMRKELMQE